MGKLKVTIHPLFFVFGLYFAIIGKVFSFIIFTLTAVIHELGHAFVSEGLGYSLNRIVLMPYGALISGDIDNLSYKDECLISLGGPLLNLGIGTLFVAIWWFFPQTYAYTDIAVFANFSLAIINLIPSYPLDGGRFLLATLSCFFKRKTARIITKAVGLFLSLLMLALFIYSVFVSVNITILFFALFMLIGVLDKSDKNCYVKTFYKFNFNNFTTPKRVKQVILNGENKVKKLFSILDGNDYYIITVVTPNGKYNLEGEELYNILINNSLYENLNNLIKIKKD